MLRRDAALSSLERDRVERLLLSADGWSPPAIARHLGCHPATVRRAFERFWAAGPDGVRQHRTGPRPDQARRARVTMALTGLVEQDRPWTAAQLAEVLGGHGIALSTRQVRRYTTVPALQAAIDHAFTAAEQRLRNKDAHQLRLCA